MAFQSLSARGWAEGVAGEGGASRDPPATRHPPEGLHLGDLREKIWGRTGLSLVSTSLWDNGAFTRPELTLVRASRTPNSPSSCFYPPPPLPTKHTDAFQAWKSESAKRAPTPIVGPIPSLAWASATPLEKRHKNSCSTKHSRTPLSSPLLSPCRCCSLPGPPSPQASRGKHPLP